MGIERLLKEVKGMTMHMTREKHFLKLDEMAVARLPYCGPPTRRIYLVSQENDREVTRQIFVQRPDAFATDLIAAMNKLRSGEISEIRYSCGLDGFMRIYVDDEERLTGEYLCDSKGSCDGLKQRLGI